MSTDVQAARVYGEAAFRVVEERGLDMNEVLERVRDLRRVFVQVPEFVTFLGAPNVARQQKEALIRRSMEQVGRVPIRDFLLFLLQRGRLDLMMPALRELQLLVEKKLGLARGRVATARELSGEEKQRLTRTLEAYTGTSLTITWAVQPELIGGVVFKSGDLLIDSSLQSQLGALKAKLMAPRIH